MLDDTLLLTGDATGRTRTRNMTNAPAARARGVKQALPAI